MGSAAKWGKRLFIGCIPIEATMDSVQLHFSQFGLALDSYLPMVEGLLMNITYYIFFLTTISKCLNHGHAACSWMC